VLSIITPLALFLVITLRPLTDKEKIIALLVLITNFSTSTGGYILIIYILLIPYLYEKSTYRIILALILILLFFPMDPIRINFLPIHFPEIVTYLSGGLILENNTLFLGIGSIIRPILNYLIMLTLIYKLLRNYSISTAFLRPFR
jgi:hypothetical protein